MGVAGSDALSAAVAVATAHGLKVTDPVVLRDRLNVLVHLRPAPVVARVAGTIARVRPGTEWLQRELAIAGHLARAGAPVVAPSPELPPGPHEHAGRVLSFWTYVADTGETADPAAAGAALGDCHAVLRDFHGSLPLLTGLTEAEAVLARLAAEEAIDGRTAGRLLQRIGEIHTVLRSLRAPIQPLHGDAHLRNVLCGPDGPLWNDWEDTCLGPVGWDAACLIGESRITGTDREDAEAALAASGIHLDPGELDLWVQARTLQGAVWGAYVARDFADRGPANARWFEAALATLRD
jgi:Ser/Thr protein kinase RdoA (MazF antagonist)